MAILCFCPPESCEGYAFALSASPTRSSSSIACFSASSRLKFKSFIGPSVIFLSTVICGKRLNCWNTIPIFCLCRLMFTLGSVMSVPSKRIVPPVGSSSLLRQRRKVDLPEPEAPITTITSPLRISALMPLST